jgi:hypothetical protein
MRALLFLLAALFAASSAQAQYPIRSASHSGSDFVGWADATGVTPTAWWSVARAAKASYATGSAQAAALRRGSDNGTCTVLIAVSGLVDYAIGKPCSSATALAWMTRGTFSGTVASTTLSTTGDPCTATAGDQIIDGVPAKNILPSAATGTVATIVSVTSCSAGAGIYTISNSYTISVAETITDLIPTFVSTAYDQTRQSLCTSATCDVVDSTAADQPPLFMDCGILGALPCLGFPSISIELGAATNFTPNASLVTSLILVVERTSGAVAASFLVENGNNNAVKAATSANALFLRMGAANGANATANDGEFHSITATSEAGANATILNIDGAETAYTLTPNATVGVPAINGNTGTNFYWEEGGIIDNVLLSSTQRSKGCANQAAFYGTPTGTACP